MGILGFLLKLKGVVGAVLNVLFKYWKVVLVLLACLYVWWLNSKVDSLSQENSTLSTTVFKQDSVITTQLTKLYQDSVVYKTQIIDLQVLTKELSSEKKELLDKNKQLNSVINGTKCVKNLWGKKVRITDCD
ncbi:MAG: hypothetical protein IPP05_22065 [Cytophagaceae bacterium]|nr:hypothetical protein [Cytophagaceae bacterium]